MGKKLTRALIVILVIALLAACGFIALNYMPKKSTETAATKIGFEDIGELATQSAYCTEVKMISADRKLLGHSIPFTQSQYLFSNDFSIKAGFDFGKILWDVDETTITVHMPEVKVLSNESVNDTMKVFYEAESIFRRVTLEENNDAFEEMKENAEKHAIANGLYDNAKINAEAMLKSFFGSVYDMNKYEIEFVYDE